jgi:hypothetical protein
MKKKIIFGSILAVLLMVSMPFLHTVQARSEKPTTIPVDWNCEGIAHNIDLAWNAYMRWKDVPGMNLWAAYMYAFYLIYDALYNAVCKDQASSECSLCASV